MKELAKKITSIFLMTFMALLVVGTVFAAPAFTPDVTDTGNTLPVDVVSVKVNGDDFSADQNTGTNYLSLERNNELEIKVRLKSGAPVSNVEVEASISGYEYNDGFDRVSDVAEPFDVEADRTYVKTLTLKLPRLLKQGQYKLRVRVSAADYDDLTYNYNVDVASVKHGLELRDVSFSPSNGVKADRTLIVDVRVKNVGEKDETDVKVEASLEDLGIKDSDFIDKVEAGDKSKSAEPLALRIPSCTKPGTYDLTVTASFDNGREEESATYPVEVLSSDSCGLGSGSTGSTSSEPTTVQVDSDTKTISRGEGGAIYPVLMTNKGTASRSYTLRVDGADWANVKVSPSSVVVLKGGESAAAYLYVSAREEAALGTQMFSLTVLSGDKVLEQVPFKAEVVDSTPSTASTNNATLKSALEYVLAVLVIVLVIVGIVLLVQKARGKEDEDAQAYY